MAANATVAGQTLYVLSCDARLTLFDTTTTQVVGHFNLAERTGKEALIPTGAGSLDGCLANQALYDPAASAFYTTVPNALRGDKDGKRNFRVLEFSVPNVQLVRTLPGGDNLTDPRRLGLDSAGHLNAETNDALLANVRTQVAHLTLGGEALRFQPLEISGHRVLVRLFASGTKEPRFAVADLSANTLVTLPTETSTIVPNVHLAPDGAAVLLEETVRGSRPQRTGKLVLLDSSSGRVLSEIDDPRIKADYFLAISASGFGVYYEGDLFVWVPLSMKFPSTAVTRLNPVAAPAYFFVDQ